MNKLLERLGLRFADRQLEADFLQHYLHRHRGLLQLALLAGGVTVYVFFLWDKVIDPARYEQTHAIRGLIVTPYLWASAAILWIPAFRKYLEYVLTAGIIFASLGLTSVYVVLERGFDYGVEGQVLAVLFCTALFPIRFKFFCLFCLVATIGFFGAQLQSTSTTPGMLTVNALCMGAAVLLGLATTAWREIISRSQFVTARELDASRQRVTELLHSVLPSEIVTRIQNGETAIADAYGEVSIVFADLVGFTEISRRLSPARLVELLNSLFSKFDDQATLHGLDRIKTIGDAYMAIGGMKTDVVEDHAQKAAKFALAVQGAVDELAAELDYAIKVRVGLHVGPIVAGVIGVKRPAFDCWGEAVNLASRLENSALPGSILISESAYWRLRDRFEIEVIDEVNLKGIGATKVYVLKDELPRRRTG